MAKAKQQVDEMNERDAPTTGRLEVPEEQDTSAQSMTEAILADFAENSPPKKAGRPKEQPPEQVAEDDDSAPPEHLMQGEEVEDTDDSEQSAEATEGDDDTEPSDLEGKLSALAEEYGVDPQLLDGMESVEEAERFIDRYMRTFYREGQQGADYYYPQNGYAANGHAEAIPAAQNGAVQKQNEKPPEINLDEFDDDEPVKPVLKKLVEQNTALAKKLEQLETADRRRQEVEFDRAQRQAALEFQNELFRISPELFGNAKQQTPRQARQARMAFEAADTLIRGFATRGAALPSITRIAKWATQAEFAEELANTKLLATRASVAERAKKRLGAPARVSRGNPSASSAKVFEGPMDQDPDILQAVRSTLSRTRD